MSHAGSDAAVARLHGPVPLNDELLTSYLARAACRHGMGAYRFCSFYLHGIPVWNRDFDRSASDNAVTRIAKLFELDEAQVRAMTLRDYDQAVMKFGTSPWINSAGSSLRNSRSHGLQYCPECLSEDPSFKRAWRLACVVACQRHRRVLSDCCIVCREPIIPHLAQISTLRCHHCGAWLTAHAQNISSGCTEIPFRIQQLLVSALSGQQVTILCRCSSGPDLARCAAGLIRIARERARCRLMFTHELGSLPPVRFELMRVADRAKVLTVLERALLDDSHCLEHFCKQLGLVHDDFETLGALPSWLSDCLGRLPVEAHPRRSRTSQSIATELTNIRLRRKPGWREAQAGLLVRFAVGDRGY